MSRTTASSLASRAFIALLSARGRTSWLGETYGSSLYVRAKAVRLSHERKQCCSAKGQSGCGNEADIGVVLLAQSRNYCRRRRVARKEYRKETDSLAAAHDRSTAGQLPVGLPGCIRVRLSTVGAATAARQEM